jgi:DNA-binding protein HU-beta
MTTKAEVVTGLATKLNCTKVTANLFLDTYQNLITESLKKGQKVPLLDLGMLRVSRTKARSQKVPTGATVQIPAKNVIKLSLNSDAKRAVNPEKKAEKAATPKAAPKAAPKATVPPKTSKPAAGATATA